jgi:hypothetical protein
MALRCAALLNGHNSQADCVVVVVSLVGLTAGQYLLANGSKPFFIPHVIEWSIGSTISGINSRPEMVDAHRIREIGSDERLVST